MVSAASSADVSKPAAGENPGLESRCCDQVGNGEGTRFHGARV